MDKNTIIGLVLIFILLLVWQQYMAPSQEEIQEQQRLQDSIALVQQQEDSLLRIEKQATDGQQPVPVADSLRQLSDKSAFGPFAPAASGEAQDKVLENGERDVARDSLAQAMLSSK